MVKDLFDRALDVPLMVMDVVSVGAHHIEHRLLAPLWVNEDNTLRGQA